MVPVTLSLCEKVARIGLCRWLTSPPATNVRDTGPGDHHTSGSPISGPDARFHARSRRSGALASGAARDLRVVGSRAAGADRPVLRRHHRCSPDRRALRTGQPHRDGGAPRHGTSRPGPAADCSPDPMVRGSAAQVHAHGDWANDRTAPPLRGVAHDSRVAVRAARVSRRSCRSGLPGSAARRNRCKMTARGLVPKEQVRRAERAPAADRSWLAADRSWAAADRTDSGASAHPGVAAADRSWAAADRTDSGASAHPGVAPTPALAAADRASAAGRLPAAAARLPDPPGQPAFPRRGSVAGRRRRTGTRSTRDHPGPSGSSGSVAARTGPSLRSTGTVRRRG